MNKESIRKSFNEAISRINHIVIKSLLKPAKYEDEHLFGGDSYIDFDFNKQPNKRINYTKLILAFIKHCLLSDSVESLSYRELYEEKIGWIDLEHIFWDLGEQVEIFNDKVIFINQKFNFAFCDFVGLDPQESDLSKMFAEWSWDKVETEVKAKCSKIAHRFSKERILNCTIISLARPSYMIHERDKQILCLYNTYLTPVGCRFIYIDDYIKEKVPQQVFDFFR